MSDHQQWLDQVREEIIDPARPIIDPHHHLWRESRLGWPYLLEDLRADTGGGHNIVKTVFLECHAEYLSEGPEHLRPVGETTFVAGIAEASAASDGAEIAGIVSRADLRLGAQLDEVLDAHEQAGGGRFRGIRHAGACTPDPTGMLIPGGAPKGLYADEAFRAGVRRLGERGYTYDTWHYHFQNEDFAQVARAAPDTTMILDHFGTPLGVGAWAGKRDAIFDEWKKGVEAVAACDNVVAKLGGLAMPDNGFGWNGRDRPPTSDEFVEAQRPYYLHMIELFGPERCMFESNFPVDRLSLSYPVLWNGLKKIAAGFSEDEKQLLFHDTAARIYGLAS